MTGHQTYELGDVQLQSGAVLKNAQLAYATYGTLNAAGDNAVLLPTFYTGTHFRNEPLFGLGRAIDPARHFVVSVNLFGNGYSSSPSNTPAPQDGPRARRPGHAAPRRGRWIQPWRTKNAYCSATASRMDVGS